MKQQQIIIIGILVLLSIIACIALTDSIASLQGPSDNSSVSNISKPTTTGITAKSTPTAATPTAATNVTATKATTVIPTSTPTPVSYTTTQIYEHLIDIAFGTDNIKIIKVTTSTEKISIDGSFTNDDWINLNKFKEQFNNLSTTLRLSEPTEGSQGIIIFNFMPETALNSLSDDTSYNTIYGRQLINYDENNTICSIYRTVDSNGVQRSTVYINSDLTGNKRTHYMLRGMLYYLGFMGESAKYSSSIFYSQPNDNPRMNSLDIKAAQLMYGTKITNGMTVGTIQGFY